MNGTRRTALLHDDGIRVLRVNVAKVAEHAAKLHKLQPYAARLQADALAAAALLGAYLDEHERLTLQLQLETPRMAFTADVDWDGRIRCRTTPPGIGQAERLKGVMLVLKSVHGREVYRGITAVEHTELAAVLQEHLTSSSQVPAAVELSEGEGVFVEKMPGQAPDVDLIDVLIDVWKNGVHGEEAELNWSCTCSRDRVLQMLATLGDAEVQSMIDEDDGAKVSCNFCRNETVLTAADLRTILST